jgi:hypothetical protein
VAGAVAPDFFCMIVFLKGFEDAAGDIPFGDDTYKLIILVGAIDVIIKSNEK